jgi:transcription elongation factor GreB
MKPQGESAGWPFSAASTFFYVLSALIRNQQVPDNGERAVNVRAAAVGLAGRAKRSRIARMNDAPNYITPAGFRRLNDELTRLWRVERPPVVATVAWAAGNGDRSENGDYIYGKQKLRQIDRRIRHLSKRLDTAVVVDNAGKAHERVFFGATVTFAHLPGGERTVTIVGVDELDAGDTRISWRSPMATAMLKAGVGDIVTLRTPRGPERIEIIAIRYDAIE